MRCVTYVLEPEQGYIDPGEEVMRENGVIPEAIHDVDALDDGTVVVRLSVRGELADVRACLEAGESGGVDYEIAEGSREIVLHLHFHPGPLLRALLDVHRRHAVLFEYPLEYVGPSNRHLRVSEVGPEDALGALIADTREVVSVEIERLGSYDPAAGRLFADTTARQREVLRVAVEEGYYEVPRRVTYEDIAARLECSAGAVGQHLRRIESTIMPEIVTDSRSVDEPSSIPPGG